KLPEYRLGETEVDESLEAMINETVKQVEDSLENMQFSVALSSIWQLISRTNKYIDETAPWVLAKDETSTARLGNVMAHLADSLRVVAVMLQAFLTRASVDIFKQLGIQDYALKELGSVYDLGQVKAGTTVQIGSPIFPRLDVEEEVAAIKAMMQGPKTEE